MATIGSDAVHIGDRVAEIAAAEPHRLALRFLDRRGGEQLLTYSELESRANVCARELERRGVGEQTVVGVVLGRRPEHLSVTLGAWKLGATVVPIDPALPAEERHRVATIPEVLLLGAGPESAIALDALTSGGDGAPMPGRGLPRSGTMTGASTGRPRIILHERGWCIPRGVIGGPDDAAGGLRVGQVQLVVLPLHHAGFTTLYYGLALAHSIVLLEEFSGALFFDVIERHRVNYLRLVPSYMRLALDVPGAATANLGSLEALNHGGAKCPEVVKRRFLELLGPERVYEDYSSMERIGRTRWITMIRGDEWLAHPGSVGRPRNCEVRILGDDGQQLPPGSIGRVFVRAPGARQPTYLGEGAPLPEQDGFRSVGDQGYLDDNGYLYLVGRAGDVINTGGRKVHAGQVEDVLLRHPAVADAVVIGVPHEYLGSALRAVVVARGPLTPEALEAHCRAHLALALVPLSYELRGDLGRSESGKLPLAARAALSRP